MTSRARQPALSKAPPAPERLASSPAAFNSLFGSFDHREPAQAQSRLGNLMRQSARGLAGPRTPLRSPPAPRALSPQAGPIAQLLKEPQKKTLAGVLGEIERFYELLRSLSDPLGFGVSSSSLQAAAKLPLALEQVKAAVLGVRALGREVQDDPDVPFSESQILLFAAHTMAPVLRPLLENAQALTKQLQGGKVEQEAAHQELARLSGQAAEVLSTELRSMHSLFKDAPPLRQPPNPTRRISMGEIRFSKPFYSGSQVLATLRSEHGITSVEGDGMTVLNARQSTVIVNGLLSVVLIYKDYVNTEVNALLPIPDDGGGRLFAVRYIFDEHGRCTVKAEAVPARVQENRYASVPEAQKALMHKYGIKAFTESGAAWTVGELVQVEDAFDKAGDDRALLRGITLERVAAGGHDTQATLEGGSYNPATHILKLTSSAFAQNLVTFVGGAETGTGQASAGTILHEVGHVVEFAAWREQDRAFKEQIEKNRAELEFLERRQKELYEHSDQLREEHYKARDHFIDEKFGVLGRMETERLALSGKIKQASELTLNRQKAALEARNAGIAAAPKQGEATVIDLLNAFLKTSAETNQALNTFRSESTSAEKLELFLKALAAGEAAQKNYGSNSGAAALACTAPLNLMITCFQQAAETARTLQALQSRLLAAREEAEKMELEFAEKERLLEASFTPRSEELEKGLAETSSRASSAREEGRKLSSAHHEFSIAELRNSARLQKFMKFVTANGIHPISNYALTEFKKGNNSEFFAESYHLFRNDPGFLNRASPKLYRYFAEGTYLT